MIKSLMIKNFAIIDLVNIDFETGMTVLTGETGAGKSIIIDAIGQLLGDRANSGLVKTGEEKSFIEAVVDISQHQFIKEQLLDLNFEIDDDLVVSKEITKDGKSSCKINYRTVNMNILKNIMEQLIDIHSQFETQYLLNEKVHIHLLDEYAKSDLKTLFEEYKDVLSQYVSYKKEYEKLSQTDLNVEQVEYYQHQIKEIEDAQIEENELEDLEKEKKQLQSFEKTNEKVQIVKKYVGDQSLPDLHIAIKAIESLVDDETYQEVYDVMMDSYYRIEDAYEKMIDYFNSMNYSEYRLNEIQERIFNIQKIQRKYGYTIEEIIAYKEDLLSKIEMIENRDYILEQLSKKVSKTKSSCIDLANKIHTIREKKANDLQLLIQKELNDLYMNTTIFKVDVQKTDIISSSGMDQVTFLISTNVGHDLKPLSKIASGGELSRLMLALKTVFSSLNQISTVIFDEVDTGVSGKVAQAIGLKMKKIANDSQVLCITHLPQVASFASAHLYISKYVENNTTKTKVEWLNRKQRITEIAKMLSGDQISDIALENAEYLIQNNSNIHE